jgi:hypothetical protein
MLKDKFFKMGVSLRNITHKHTLIISKYTYIDKTVSFPSFYFGAGVL